ncbi:hypothetical protein [Kitasatospora viridis]|uniref:ABC-2 type transport system permease protein n=1 Tax=Kitasatospora viridis TaxID=281105 RepID=A0A561UE10_9ACTN|nr:hypothetical protein [Kitasatospora viridis]TWF97591.1 hypothetical protein FHX73_111377 [Kitasatospora viridis]
MRVLAYEARRLLGVRSTWLILATALALQAVLAAVAVRHAAPDQVHGAELVRYVTASLPLLPVPVAGLAAGLLGVLAAGHEVRRPGLPASQVRYLARIRLLLAKLCLVGATAALLAAASLPLNALVLRLAAPAGTVVAAADFQAVEQLRTDHRPLLVLATFAALVVAAAWTGVLAATVCRSAIAGFLLLCALPMLVELLGGPSELDRLRRIGLPWVAWVARAPWAEPASAPLAALRSAAEPVPALGAVLLPVLLLLALCLLGQARRRSF